MNYTLNQLRIFLKVVEKKSITKASEELHLTQPAVSIQVKNFQAQFDIPLLENIGRKIYITNFGNEIAKSCKVILEEVERVELRKMAYLGHLIGKLQISVVSTAKYVMPNFLSEFMRNHAGVQLNMDVTNKMKVIRSLEENKVDFALVSVLPKGLPIEKVTLMENKLYLVGKKGDEQAADIKRPEDIGNLPLIYRENGSATRLAMEAYIKKHKIVVNRSMELTSNEAVKQAVLAGLGYSIMPVIGLRNEIRNEEIQVIKLKELPVITDWNLIWLKDKAFSPAAAAYLEFIKEKKASIIESQFSWYSKFN